MNAPRTPATEPCPQCGASMAVTPGYVTWCQACGHDPSLSTDVSAPRRSERIHDAISRRLGGRLRDEAVANGAALPALDALAAPALAISALVHAATFAWLALALWLLALAALNLLAPEKTATSNGLAIIAVFGAVLALLVFFLLWPGAAKRPPNALTRAHVPHTFAVADAIAQRMGTRTVDFVVIDNGFGAAISSVGLARRRMLTLGLPPLAF